MARKNAKKIRKAATKRVGKATRTKPAKAKSR